MAPKAQEERRADPDSSDKKKYTQAEFEEFYGKKKGNAVWAKAGGEDDRAGGKSDGKAGGKDGGSNSLALMKGFQGCVLAEYVWLDAHQVSRSKTMTMTCVPKTLKDLRVWNYDGSSTEQAEGHNSEVLLYPKAIFADPFRGAPHIMVLAEAVNAWDDKPAIGNTRAACNDMMEKFKRLDPWFGIEQEYTLMRKGRVGEPGTVPLGFNEDGSEPAPQGPYYCGAGTNKAIGRDVAYEHYMKCLEAGVKIAGSNAEVMPGQWEYQVGPCCGVEMGDHLTMSRYIMHRITEKHDVICTFAPKPIDGDWNGAGCHTNFSVAPMRKEGGFDVIQKVCDAFSKVAKEHVAVYGEGNEKRLTGQHETCDINTFRFGVADRGASIRIPREAEKNGKGYMEDRRPAANCDPYLVTAVMLKTTGECLEDICSCSRRELLQSLKKARDAGKTPAVIVLAGSFNPLHGGHVKSLQTSRTDLEGQGKFAVIAALLVPSSDKRIMKKFPDESIADKRPMRQSTRNRIIELVTKKEPWMGCLSLAGLKVTDGCDSTQAVMKAVDMVREYLGTGEAGSDIEAFQIVGADTVGSYGGWDGIVKWEKEEIEKDPSRKFPNHLVVCRPGEDLPSGSAPGWFVVTADGETSEDSSTQVRKDILAKEWDKVAAAVGNPTSKYLRELSESGTIFFDDL